MKYITPDYYKDFKCIAGDCTDTCCAGWDVDVDDVSYRYYKKVKGAFGKRLKSVMVPEEEGGCTFILTKDNRCPFLNERNLCDLYTELGEDKLCETCAEFPRFINRYGAITEMGIAPSCKTAGELILAKRGPATFDVADMDEQITVYNDYDPVTYIQLRNARNVAFTFIGDDYFGGISRRLMLYLSYSRDIQKHMDDERDDLIANVAVFYNRDEYCVGKIDRAETIAVKAAESHRGRDDRYYVKMLKEYFSVFKGYEVINPDWNIYAGEVRTFLDGIDDTKLNDIAGQFNQFMGERLSEYEQLSIYYIFRYFLDAVNDYNVELKAKNAVVGYVCLKLMGMADWYMNGRRLDFVRQVDLAHLYSRQFEHSYYNFEVYREMFMTKRRYGYNSLMTVLMMIK